MVDNAGSSGCLIYFDGDDVGARIELHLLQDEAEIAGSVSAVVEKAVGKIADELRDRLQGTILFAAGDEILAMVPDWPGLEEVERLRELFRRSTGLTISAGVGATPAETARNLRIAKLRGKDQVRGSSPS